MRVMSPPPVPWGVVDGFENLAIGFLGFSEPGNIAGQAREGVEI